MKSALKAVIETTTTATAASACSQNTAHAASIWPWLLYPPMTLIEDAIIVKMLRHKIPPSTSLRRRLILIFHSSRTGTEMTVQLLAYELDEKEGCIWSLESMHIRNTSVIISEIATASRTPLSLERAPGVTHSTRRTKLPLVFSFIRSFGHRELLTQNSFVKVITRDEIGKHQDGSSRDQDDQYTPPPYHQLLLMPEECSKEEQKGELDADNRSSEQYRGTIF